MAGPVGQKRWGIRSLLYLGLAAVSIIVSNWMRMTGNTDVILLTFIGTVVGLAGATVSTIRGHRAWGGGLPRGQPPTAPATPARTAAPPGNWAVTPGPPGQTATRTERHQWRDERCGR
jgi:hypothetical protein